MQRATSIAALLCLASAPARAFKPDQPLYSSPDANLDTPKMMDGIRIEDKAGAQIPPDIKLLDQDGKEVTIGSYFDGTRPVVLVLAYYSCPMLCTLVLNGTEAALKDVAWTAGNQYRVLTVSIDDRDTPERAKAKRENYIKAYGRTVAPGGWDFLTGKNSETKRLADAIGFHYRWDADQEQFAHAAGAFIVTPTGKVSHVFYGVQFDPNDLRLALDEASGGKFSKAMDQLLLKCFHYDPKVGKYVLAAHDVMMGGGAITVFGMGFAFAMLMRGENKKSRERI